MTGTVFAAFLLAVSVSAAPAFTKHRPQEHGAAYLPVTAGPEYVDLVTQLLAKRGLKPDFEYRQNLLKGLRVSELVDRDKKPGGHTLALLIVRQAKDKARARAMARKVIEPEDWADVGRTFAKSTLTIAEHLKAVRDNLAYIDGHVKPGYLTVDLVWLERQLERDTEDADGALYITRSPRAPKP
ncbi:MAG: hypothetical protein Q7J64_00955 [Elusimicrobiota bacterium]|nr:hypothetical protein [Elusimicrobiota bacterium]